MIRKRPAMLHIVGRKGSGKTALVTGLIRRLTSRGYRVAAVRHSPHDHCTDPAGTDTSRYRDAGASGTALVGARESAFFIRAEQWEKKTGLLSCGFADSDLILIEGGIRNGREKIEVVPEGEEPLCAGDASLRAVVGSSAGAGSARCFAAGDSEAVSRFIEKRYLSSALSAAVLAGGRSSRLGRNKALLQVGGITIVERILSIVSRFSPDVRIITNTPADYRYLDVEAVPDIRPGCGPLSGIHTALHLSATEYVLVTSCDIPLMTAGLVGRLTRACAGADITICKHSRFEPLCAVYRRTCIAALEELIDHGEFRIIDLFPTLFVNVIRVDDDEPFRNINTEKDYQYILGKLSG